MFHVDCTCGLLHLFSQDKSWFLSSSRQANSIRQLHKKLMSFLPDLKYTILTGGDKSHAAFCTDGTMWNNASCAELHTLKRVFDK